MVHPKAKSGDPDYDDKVPLNRQQYPTTVQAGTGETVFITPDRGPVDQFGAHVNLDVDPEEGDNRPAPGEVATEESTVQVFTPPSAPEADPEDVHPAGSGTSVQPATEVVKSEPAPKVDLPTRKTTTNK